MTRRCSNCGHDGHNSRTCSDRGVVLFGVRLNEGGVRKSSSMGNLAIASAPMPKTSSVGNLYAGLGPNHGASPAASPGDDEPVVEYGSEDMAERSSSSSRERKKGTPWTEEEHRRFLVGLNKLGKGDWRGIARYYVLTRTPTQVASHAQKHFMRQINAGRRRRRSSLFDMINAETAEPESPPMDCQEPEVQENPVQPEVEKENPIQSSSITSNDVNDSVIAEANHQPQTSLYNMPMQNKGCTSNNANKSVIEEANHQPQTSLYNFQLLNKGCTSDDANKSVKEEANQQPPPTTTAAAYNYPIPIPAYVSPFVQAPVIIWPTYNPGISGQLNYGAGTSGQPFYIAGPSWQPDYAGGAPGQSGHAVETSWRPSYIASTSGQASHAVVQQVHQIIKPTALHTKSPINVNELVDISNLSIGISSEGTASLPPAFDLNGKTQRQSAFHFKPLSSAD